jgi:hypothetical protein
MGIKDFRVENQLGKGAFGDVFKVSYERRA